MQDHSIHIGEDQYGEHVFGMLSSIDYWRYMKHLELYEFCIAGHILYIKTPGEYLDYKGGRDSNANL